MIHTILTCPQWSHSILLKYFVHKHPIMIMWSQFSMHATISSQIIMSTYLISQLVYNNSRCYRLLYTWNVTVGENLPPGFGRSLLAEDKRSRIWDLLDRYWNRMKRSFVWVCCSRTYRSSISRSYIPFSLTSLPILSLMPELLRHPRDNDPGDCAVSHIINDESINQLQYCA